MTPESPRRRHLTYVSATAPSSTASAGEPFVGDVAISDAVIAAVGSVDGGAAREIDATGLLVTPGFIDLHTHYDGQAIWSDRMTPSSAHGVTTAVMGNCASALRHVAERTMTYWST